ncbi:MAG: histidine kinase dimerization/phospho-acceptor domain-containing protein [Gaiellaceae bacterium]|jgi:signal transduction histidine kinase
MANWVNLIVGVIQIAIAIVVVFELVRLRRGFPPVAILLVAFFVLDGIVALNRPDRLLGYSSNLDAVLTVIDTVVLIGLLVYVRRLVRGALQTVSEAELRAREYERAGRDYASLLRHRIANPLMTIEGAARTLRARRGDEEKRDQLLESIIEASQNLERISLEPRLRSAEEIELEPVPQLEEPSTNGR